MLPSLRSTVTRALPNQPRRFLSVQADANSDVLFNLFTSTFGTSESSPPLQVEQQPTLPAPTPQPQPRIMNHHDIPPAQDPLLEFITSRFMQDGKRSRAAKSTAETLLHLHALTKAPPLPILREAIGLAAPAVRVMRHKTGGKILVKPVALNERQRTKAAIDWIMDASRLRPEHTRGERMARECIRVIQGTSKALDKKEDVHKLAMISRGNLPRTR